MNSHRLPRPVRALALLVSRTTDTELRGQSDGELLYTNGDTGLDSLLFEPQYRF